MDEVEQNIVICLWRADQYYYLLKPKAETNNWSARHWQITIFCDNRALSVDHRVGFYNEYLWEAKQSAIFTQEQSQGGENTVSFMHEQNIRCSKTQLDGIAHEQTIICRQLFAGHMVGSRPMKRKKKFASNDFALLFIQNIFCFWLAAISGWFFITRRRTYM